MEEPIPTLDESLLPVRALRINKYKHEDYAEIFIVGGPHDSKIAGERIFPDNKLGMINAKKRAEAINKAHKH